MQRYGHTLQTRDCNIITLHEIKKEQPFWMDHTSYFHRLRTAALRGHKMSSGNTRPDCNLKHFAVHLSEWQRNKRNHCCVFIYLYVLLAFTDKNLLLNFLGKKDFPLRQRYIICFYPLTRKTHQSFLAWLHIVGNSNLDNKLCWIEPFVEILACHIDRIFEEIIAHFNEMKKKNIAWCTHTVFPITCTDTPTVIVWNGKCLLFASNGLDLNIIESEFN